MQFQMMALVGEFERNTIAQNVKMGMKAKARSGEWCGGIAPLGYCRVPMEGTENSSRKKSRLEIDKTEAEIVRLIYHMYASGKGYKAIVNYINQIGSRRQEGMHFLCHNLKLWDLTDRTPNRYHMTFPANYNLSKPKEENIRCVQCKKALYDLGIAEVTTPGGNTVRAYRVERTLCDILRSYSHVDIQIVAEAFKHYATSSNKNIPVLSEYAKVLKVETKLKSYLEVLL